MIRSYQRSIESDIYPYEIGNNKQELYKLKINATFWRIYYHTVWSTFDRLPLITENIEEKLYKYIKNKCYSLDRQLHAIGGIIDHIHLVISIPPSMSISDFVRQIKGSSFHFVNQTKLESESKFAWQREYGVFSLGGQQLVRVASLKENRAVAYANNQKEHHAQGSIERFLEPEIIHTKQ